MKAIYYNGGLVTITEGDVTPDTLRSLRRELWRKKLSPVGGSYYTLNLTGQQADQLSATGHEELIYMNDPGSGLALCEGFRVNDIGYEVEVAGPGQKEVVG